MKFFDLIGSIVLIYPIIFISVGLSQSVDQDVAMTFKEVAQRSQQFTVLITSSNNSQGSGVIIKHERNKYIAILFDLQVV